MNKADWMAEEFGGVGFGERVLAGAGCAVGGGRVLWVGLGFTERERRELDGTRV